MSSKKISIKRPGTQRYPCPVWNLPSSHFNELVYTWKTWFLFLFSNLNITLWQNIWKNKHQKRSCWLKTTQKWLTREKRWQQVFVWEHKANLFMNTHLARSAIYLVKLAFLHWMGSSIFLGTHSLPKSQHTRCRISPTPAKWKGRTALTTQTNLFFM